MITVPTNLNTDLKNITENWIVQLFNSSKTDSGSDTDEQLNTNETALDVDDGGDFKVGDIVEWSAYAQDQEDWVDNYGIITAIENEIQSGRLISVSSVLPISGPQIEIKFFTASLRLVSRTDQVGD